MSASILETCKLLTRWAFEYFDQTGFKQPLESCKLLTHWAFEYFDQTGATHPC